MRSVRGQLGGALLLTCALWGAGAGPAPAAPPDSATPVVVGERRFSAAELRAALRPAPTKAEARQHAATRLILGEWDARRAQTLGVVVPEAAVDAALAEAMRQTALIGGTYGDLTTPAERRIELAEGIRRELIMDAILRDLAPGPRAFGRAFDKDAARQRAVTRCLAKYADPDLDLCRNRPKHAGGCAPMGLVEICREVYRDAGYWKIASNVLGDFYDPPAAFDEPDPNPGFDRLLRYIRAYAPAGRRCFWETDDAWIGFICSTRKQAIAVAYAITRVHQKAKQSWTVPATYGRL